MSIGTVKVLLENAELVPLIPIEDVSLALLVESNAHVRLRCPQNWMYHFYMLQDPSNEDNVIHYKHYAAVHTMQSVSQKTLRKLWLLFSSKN